MEYGTKRKYRKMATRHHCENIKKRDQTKCQNSQTITLLNIISKAMTILILEQLKSNIEKKFRQIQVGFRTRRARTDHIVTLRIITDQANE